MESVKVIGAGLAGCEAAWQLSKRGVKVKLFEMKGKKFSPAHKSSDFAELVCSNSLKSNDVDSASGLLKEEMRLMDSLILKCADATSVPAGSALAVDREKFSSLVTKYINQNDLIEVIREEVTSFENCGLYIIATGPLTSPKLCEALSSVCGGMLSFYDAASPIITSNSIDYDYAFWGSRYGKGDDMDYLNCPLDKDDYEIFYNELILAERAKLRDFESKVYEACMPIEVLAERGKDAIRFGPMKPVGLINPKTEKRPWAVLQLRKENLEGTLYNLVGFQTNLKFCEQKRVFGIIKALKNAEFMRYGVMHANTFVNSPRVLEEDLSIKKHRNLFLAGQITGVEGYLESTACGMVAAFNVLNRLNFKEAFKFPLETMIGALINYVVNSKSKNFQPMGANFGILPQVSQKFKDKKEKNHFFSVRSIELLKKIKGVV